MKKLILLILLIPGLCFALTGEKLSGTINCNDIPTCVCRDACKADEYIITKVKILAGKNKDKIIGTTCGKDSAQVCCTKDTPKAKK